MGGDTLSNRLVVDSKIDKWFDDRGITENGTAVGQALKTLEEVTELLTAISLGNKTETIDAIGDVYVTLRGVCKTYGLNMESCIRSAYEEIKDRQGYLREDGVFVKEV